MNIDFRIGNCPFCAPEGSTFIVADINTNQLIVWCNECDTIWDTPQDFSNNNPNVEKTQITFKIKNATLEEIELKGWSRFINSNT